MQVERSEEKPLRTQDDVVLARQIVRQWARSLGMSLINQTKLVTAASELGRNALVHGGGGTLVLEVVHANERRGLRLVFADEGPGIRDVEQAMRDGFTTGSGLGLGLGGSRRLVDEFDIRTAAGAGTRVVVVKWI